MEANPRTSSQPTCTRLADETRVQRDASLSGTHPNDVATLKGLFSLALLEQLALSVGRDETPALGLAGGGHRARNRCQRRRVQRSLGDSVTCLGLFVAANKTFPSLSDDECLATTAGTNESAPATQCPCMLCGSARRRFGVDDAKRNVVVPLENSPKKLMKVLLAPTWSIGRGRSVV